MGIKGLAKLLSQHAPESISEHDIKYYHGRAVAIDASMFLYQFLVAVRSSGPGGSLTNASGEVTSHLIGMFYRTIRMRENGVKCCYVFDGKPPQMKSGELEERRKRRQEAAKKMEEAKNADNPEDQAKYERRLVKVSPKHVADTKTLLTLMGVPFVTASCEAEATCAELTKQGKVWATATEDMDALTFGTPRLLRGLHHSAARKAPVRQFDLAKALDGLDMSMEQFIDMCICCGCDYTSSIRGIGPGRSLQFIRQHKTIETMIENLNQKKHKVPDDFAAEYKQARGMFTNADVADVSNITLKWKEPDEEGLIDFLCTQKEFNIDRVKKGVERLRKAKGKSSQKRLDSFFKIKPRKKKKVAKPVKGKGKKRKNSTKTAQKGKKRKI